MGCLFELLFEFVVTIFFELSVKSYMGLMQLIIPDKIISEKAKKMLKNVVTTVCALSLCTLIVGVVLFVQREKEALRIVGKYMTYIPLGIIIGQIALGILVHIISYFRERR